jgi:hypothetical protein
LISLEPGLLGLEPPPPKTCTYFFCSAAYQTTTMHTHRPGRLSTRSSSHSAIAERRRRRREAAAGGAGLRKGLASKGVRHTTPSLVLQLATATTAAAIDHGARHGRGERQRRRRRLGGRRPAGTQGASGPSAPPPSVASLSIMVGGGTPIQMDPSPASLHAHTLTRPPTHNQPTNKPQPHTHAHTHHIHNRYWTS